MPGLQAFKTFNGVRRRAEATNDGDLLIVTSEHVVLVRTNSLCNFNAQQGFHHVRHFRQSSPRRVLILGRTSIRPAWRRVRVTAYDAQLSSRRENVRHRRRHAVVPSQCDV